VLIVDAGNLLLYRKHYRPAVKADDAAIKRRVARAGVIAQGYAQLGAHAVAVGATDLVLGLSVLQGLVRTHRLPLLSANLQSAAGKQLFPSNKIVMVGGIKIGIFGLTGEKNIARAKIDPKLFKLANPIKAAQAQVKELRAKGAQIVVGLAAVGHQVGRKVAELAKGVDFLFVSGTGRHGERASRVGTAWMMEMSREGKYIGHITLYLKGGKLQFEDLSERYQLANRLKRIDKSIKGLEKRLASFKGQNKDYMVRRMTNSKNSRERMMVKMAKANSVVPKGSFFTNVMQPVALSLKRDPAIRALINKVTKEAGLKRPRGAN
jgi:2',3'-cyclic-nucleotide 2'-phosphodiesterase (5'-nucleotidase family)